MGVLEMQAGLRSQFQSLQWQLEEHLPAGSPVEVVVGLPRDLTAEELLRVRLALQEYIELTAVPQIGATAEWPNALRLKFRRPVRKNWLGRSVQLAGVLRQPLEDIGVDNILGWRIGGQ